MASPCCATGPRRCEPRCPPAPSPRPRVSNVGRMTQAFTGATLDRADDARRRDPEWLAGAREHPRARAIVAGTGGVRVEGPRLARVPLDGRPADLLLGFDAEGPLFALDEDAPADGLPPLIGAGGQRGEPPAPSADRIGLRQAAMVFSQEDGGLAAY